MVPRPALLISHGLGPESSLLWVLMITNAQHASWPGDIDIPNAEALGLLIPSKVRTAKVSTVERGVANFIGRLDVATFSAVGRAVSGNLGP